MSVEKIFARYGGKCLYCKEPVFLYGTPGRNRWNAATRDHFIPISAGGKKGKSNQVLACRKCNQSKSSFDPHTLVRAWHVLDRDRLHAYVKELDETRETPEPVDNKLTSRGVVAVFAAKAAMMTLGRYFA